MTAASEHNWNVEKLLTDTTAKKRIDCLKKETMTDENENEQVETRFVNGGRRERESVCVCVCESPAFHCRQSLLEQSSYSDLPK
jgi:hypothetical protein